LSRIVIQSSTNPCIAAGVLSSSVPTNVGKNFNSLSSLYTLIENPSSVCQTSRSPVHCEFEGNGLDRSCAFEVVLTDKGLCYAYNAASAKETFVDSMFLRVTDEVFGVASREVLDKRDNFLIFYWFGFNVVQVDLENRGILCPVIKCMAVGLVEPKCKVVP
jgi:hypothetical protein